MQIQHHKLFPTLVTQIDNFVSPEQCLKILDYGMSLAIQDPHHNALVGEGKSYFSEEADFLTKLVGNVAECSDIWDKISDEVRNYGKATGFSEKHGITNSWFNLQGVGSLLMNHTHPGSSISGALYINVDEDSSPISFFTPNPYISFSDIRSATAYTEFTYEWFTIKPLVGTLVLFPSWLKHGANGVQNNTPNRMVISFNT